MSANAETTESAEAIEARHEALRQLMAGALDNDFFQTLRRAQLLLGGASIGGAFRPKEDPVRIEQEPTLGFAPSTVASASWDSDVGRLRMRVRFAGLLGPNGPMPLNLTEFVMDRKRHAEDRTLEAFLNTFQHRFYQLFFKAWALNQSTVDFERPGGRRHASYLASFFGAGTQHVAGRDSVPPDARVFYSGVLSSPSRNPDGLASILRDFFEMPVEVLGFQGQWQRLPQESVCRLGASPSTGSLGLNCFAGTSLWLCNLKFRIRMGPLTLRRFEQMLPGSAAHQQLRDWVLSYVGQELSWELQLMLRRSEVPACRLGYSGRLGWTTWLGAPAGTGPVDDLVISGDAK